MSGRVDDLRQRLAEELLDQAEQDAVIDLDDGVPVDRSAALERLRREPDDDQVPWRREA